MRAVAIMGRRAARGATDTGSGPDSEPDLDEVLIGRVASGEEAALGALYDRFIRRVYSLARQICGDDAATQDVVQNVFLEVWRHSERFDPNRASVSAWLLTMTHHKAIDAVRGQAALRRHTCPANESWEISVGPDADHAAIDSIVVEHLRGALAQLPPPVRQTVDLTYYGGYTQSEVAAILGIPLGTVKSRTFGAIAHLREQLQQLQETA